MAVAGFLAPAFAFAAPAAGTVIGNQATATYNDAGGTQRTATSNLVQTTVTQVKSFTLTANGARTAAPGQTVYYPHTITNTGNGTDTYSLNAPTSSNFGAGPHGSLAYYIDANGDGIPDNASPIATTGPLVAGGTFRFVVAGTVPAGAVSGNSATLTVSASDTTPTTDTNTDTTTVANSVINLTKSLSSASGASPSGPVTVTLSYQNTGTASAASVLLTDALNAGLVYVAGSGRWSVSGAAALTDANDGVEQAGSFPPGIDFRSSLGAGATVTALIPSVPAGASGNVTFQVNVAPNLAPQTINNTAQYQTASQPSTNSNTASFQVLQGAAVVANGSATISTNGTGEPVTIGTAAAGSTIAFNNYVWNRGNGTDTFDMTITSNTFPAGTTVVFLQQDGATTLINSGGAAAPDTGPIPGVGQPCPAPFVADTTVSPAVCGYRVVVRVTLPANAPNASYSIVKRATSVFNNAVFDEVTDTLAAVATNTVDVTNDRPAPPAGAAVAADGLDATTTTVIRTNTVTPGAAASTTRFRVWVTNSGSVADDFNLSAVFAAANVAGVAPPALPAGWSVLFRADASGAPADCSVVGAPLTTTGAIAVGTARFVCADVTVPPLASGAALAGNYDFDFIATSATNPSVTDYARDRVTVNAVRNMTFTPDNTSQTFPGGSIVYVHTLANLGNASDTATFPAACLTDTRAGWASAAFIDANANGTFEAGTDTPLVCGTSSVTLNPTETRAIFVRVTAPGTALPADPANVTTLGATYSGPLQVTDTTSITSGLMVVKEQQALGAAGCTNNNAPGAGYAQGAIAASPSTAAGACIAYRVTTTNSSSAPITAVTANDLVPANTRINYACSGNAVSAPSVTVGAIAATTPADGASGTVSANVGALNAGQSAVLYFCVKIDPVAAGSTVSNQASSTGTQGGNNTSAASNTVSATVGVLAGAVFAGVLQQDNHVYSLPGNTLYQRHTLTNTGTLADTFSVTATGLPGGWNLNPVLFLDANGDGQPDSAVPLANPTALAPGQVLRFVVRLTVPASDFSSNDARARIDATSVGGAVVAPVTDTVSLLDNTPRDCAVVGKSLSRINGPSPLPLVTVTIAYSPCDKARSKLFIADKLPAGMRYIAGSARWSGTGAAPLSDAVVGNDREGAVSSQIAYDWNVTTPGTVTAWVYNIPANSQGSITFNVAIEPGIPIGTEVVNTAEYNFYSASGAYELRQFTSSTYTVDGTIDLRLVGARVATANPGSTVVFTNVLTNLGTLTDTFDITLSGSTFPAGAVITLYKADGVTPLADTDGNGTPDTGPLAPGASYNIVVTVALPETTPAGAYKVSKTARSANAANRFVTVDDSVDAVTQQCRVTFDPDNQALIGRGQHVTYTHYLTNRGNCQETLRAMLGYLGDSKPGWTSAAYIDNKVAGRGSLPGVVDATDTPIVQGWTQVLAPGESVRVLVDVHAPADDTAAAKAARAKQVVDSNVTTLVVSGASNGSLVVRDTTLIDAEDIAGQPDNAIRNFTDASYASPTFWAVIGRSLYIRADAAACNADPSAVETRTVVITGANGEHEEATATETGANTGVFVLPALRVRAPPVVAADGIVEGVANDVFDFEILGCGRRIANVVTLTEPVSVVFDSRSDDPIAGATVTLVNASGGQCGTTPAFAPVTTLADGRFAFPAPDGDYCISVRPPNGYRFPSTVAYTHLPFDRNLAVTGPTSGGSYGNPFHVPAGGVVADIPLDVAAQDGLFVQKEASRAVAEIGDFVDYTVRVRNGTGNALDRADVLLADNLPAGFAYVSGTARRDGGVIANPTGGSGPRLALVLGHLDRGAQTTITYRVRIGPGAMQGDGVNRVQATYSVAGTHTASNIASAKVRVTGGVFSDKGFILGKIFMDCSANGLQDRGEEGVPGVRIVLEDGTFIVTDGGGKFSFYGISNRTHVVKVDRATLPAGARLEVISARNLGDAGSRIVDLKSGEMARADFAIAGCDAGVAAEVKARAAAAKKGDELAALAGAQLLTEPRVITDLKALPASGVVEIAPAGGMPGAAAATPVPTIGVGGFSAVMPTVTPKLPTPAPSLTPRAWATRESVALEALVPAFADNKLAFVEMKDGDTLGYAQSNVRVKGAAGATFRLTVNGVELPDSSVGKRSVLAEKEVEAWEWIGVEMRPGRNTLSVAQVDSFGNARGAETIHVLAPGRLGKVTFELPAAGGIADGKTPVKVVVRLADEDGVPVTVRTAVTLDATLGRWQVEDLDAKEPGVQAFIEGGRGEFLIMPPLAPGESQLYVSSGGFKAEARLSFLPELRSMIATGVIEGVINARNINTRALVPARAADGFELELRHLSREWNAGRNEAGVRAAFYLKGKIKGEYLLTAAYDSDKDTRERLFRDIQPDEFYPIYGDSAVRGFDAQSTSKLYVRVDKGRSYLLWGDFTTNAATEARKLSNYNRSLTGVKHHFENERVSVNAFASRDTTRQVIEELRANGTSGPFQLGTQGALINSEKIEIIARDRNQPALVVSSVPQTRFSDYEVEALTGRIVFRAPVPSVDQNLNPVFVRVTYEVDQGGPEFWVAGVDAQVKLGDRVEVGGVYVKDKNPLAPFTLEGANMTVKLGAATYVITEVARSRSGVDDLKGNAERIEIKHDSKDLKAQAYLARTDRGFENPGAYLTEGRSESGGKLDYKLSDRMKLRAEALRTEDLATGSRRDGAALAMTYQIADKLSFELGVRHATEKSGAASASPVPALDGQPAPTPNPGEVTSVRARLTGGVPFVEGATAYGEAEVDVQNASHKVLAVGGEYLLSNKGRIYARHEFISSITGPYGLNQSERQNITAVGIDTEYMKDGRVFSEYRIRDAISGGDTEAAFGLKNLWSIAPGLRLGTTFERVHSLAGTGQNENTALALALEYTANPNWKGSTRVELRDGQSQESLLYTVGLAARLNRDWTALARNAYTLTRNKMGGGEHVIDRMQAGMAWRDSETNQWNLLARVESRVENDDSQAGIDLRSTTQIVSIHGDWQPWRPFLLTARYAAKWSQDKSNGLSTRYHAQAIGGRATWEFAPKWDVGIVSSVLFGETSGSRQYGVGLEVGYLLATNLWVSGGYNFAGYRDADLAGADYTAKGPYVRLRYKFDETLLEAEKKAEAAR